MNDPRTIADRYLALWNDEDDTSRRSRLALDWTGDARYVDPIMSGVGVGGIALMIANAREQIAGHRFTLRGQPDGHGNFIRFSWNLAPEVGSPIAGGTDVVRVDDAGQIIDGMSA